MPTRYHFVYIDDDGDEVSLDNQHDFDSLIETKNSRTVIKIIE